MDHEAVDDSAFRDAWKAVKAAGITLFSAKAAPIIAASIGLPPVLVISLAASAGHMLISLISRKLDIPWL